MEGNTEMAFVLYEEMQADKVKTDPLVYTSLITTCSNKIQSTSSGADSRREQLVLLERAFGVFQDMQVSQGHDLFRQEVGQVLPLTVPYLFKVWLSLLPNLCGGSPGGNRVFAVAVSSVTRTPTILDNCTASC